MLSICMLCTFCSFFPKEQVYFNFMAAVTICSDFGAPQNKVSHCFHCFPIYLHEVMGLDAMILVFWMLSFKSTFSPSFFTFIMRLFSSILSAIRVVLSPYLRLLIFLPAILIPAWASSSLAFHMMYSAYKLNKQVVNNTQLWCTPFPVWNQSVVPCSNCCFHVLTVPVLAVASWPAYMILPISQLQKWEHRGRLHLLSQDSIAGVKDFSSTPSLLEQQGSRVP